MAKPFQIELAPHTSEKIYQQLLNLGTSTPGTRKYDHKGKLNKRPAFAQNRTVSDHESDQLPLQFYNFHYNTPRSTSEGIKGDVNDDELKIQHNTSVCPCLVDNTEEDSMVKMKKIRATSAYVRNPETYNRNPDLFLSCTPNERKHLNTFKPISWNQSYQALRFNKEWGAKTDCRATKRTSEIVKHRIDRLYVLNGSGLKLQNKYSVPDGETQLLQELSRARQELACEFREAKEIHNKSRNLSGLRNRGKDNSKTLPSLRGRPLNLVEQRHGTSVEQRHGTSVEEPHGCVVALIQKQDDHVEITSETTSIGVLEQDDDGIKTEFQLPICGVNGRNESTTDERTGNDGQKEIQEGSSHDENKETGNNLVENVEMSISSTNGIVTEVYSDENDIDKVNSNTKEIGTEVYNYENDIDKVNSNTKEIETEVYNYENDIDKVNSEVLEDILGAIHETLPNDDETLPNDDAEATVEFCGPNEEDDDTLSLEEFEISGQKC